MAKTMLQSTPQNDYDKFEFNASKASSDSFHKSKTLPLHICWSQERDDFRSLLDNIRLAETCISRKILLSGKFEV